MCDVVVHDVVLCKNVAEVCAGGVVCEGVCEGV